MYHVRYTMYDWWLAFGHVSEGKLRCRIRMWHGVGPVRKMLYTRGARVVAQYCQGGETTRLSLWTGYIPSNESFLQ